MESINHLVLVIGYPPHERENAQAKWLSYGVRFDFADDLQQAIEKVQQTEYQCIVVQSDENISETTEALRGICAVPVVILPPTYTVAEQYACVHLWAIQYARSTGHQQIAEAGGADSVRHYLDIPTGERKPLTIITVQDLSFCLEHRTVEIKGQQIDLTTKEFEILALLIMNQQQAFTYEMIMELVWKEEVDSYSRKTIANHVSNLRKKLNVSPDVPDYIKCIYSVGYKFDAK